MSGAINFYIVFLLGNMAMVNTEDRQPILRLEPEQPVYIAGETLSLVCAADMPTSITSYNFFKDATLINSSISNRLTISLSVRDAGNYFCTYNKSGRNLDSNYINLKVFELPPAPALLFEPQRSVFLVNQSVVIRCYLPRGQIATEVNLYQNAMTVQEADNFGVLSFANTQKRNSGEYTCQYKTVISGRSVDSHPSNKETLVVIDMPPTPFFRIANSLQNQRRQVEIVCEIPNPSFSLIHGYRLYRNGGEISSRRQNNQFVINYTLDFDGCYFCRSFVNISGEEVLSLKSPEIFLTSEESTRRSCQTQNSESTFGLTKQGALLYGSVLIGKLIVWISILLIFGIYILVIRLRSKKSDTEEQSFHSL